jgi:GNAT superfamily N-acetyltransferase
MELVQPFLLRDEARHNLFLGLLGTLKESPEEHPERFLWTVEEGARLLGAAARTPPYNLVLAQPQSDAVPPALAAALHADGIELPGVTAARPEVEWFADAWRAVTACTTRVRTELGMYRLTEVRPVNSVPGRMRPATDADRPQLIAWLKDFQAEALHDENTDFDRWLDARMGEGFGGVFVWEDDGAMRSLTGYGHGTPNGARIGPVYTPPELRGHGYARALVADATQWILDQGKRLCFLFTDLSNPTSNRIYQNIGYERIGDSADVAFE